MATNEPKDHIMNFFTNTLLLLATVSLMSFGLQEEDPHIVLAEEYCGCVTRMGRIIPDPEQAMAGCLRNLHLGNPLFLAAEKAAHAEATEADFSLREANWQIVENTLNWSFQNCDFVSKRLDMTQRAEVVERLLEERKALELDRREQEIAEAIMANILEDKWEDNTIYQEHPLRYTQQLDSLKKIWEDFGYSDKIHTYRMRRITDGGQLVFSYEISQENINGILQKVQVHFHKGATFEKVKMVWIGS
jgi:hypothetical protein